jgi:hypothetical protein
MTTTSELYEAIKARALALVTDRGDNDGFAMLFEIARNLKDRDGWKDAPRNTINLALLQARDEICEQQIWTSDMSEQQRLAACERAGFTEADWDRATDELEATLR